MPGRLNFMDESRLYLRALRAQLVHAHDGGIIIRRGLTQVKVSGDAAARIVVSLYERCSRTITKDDLLASFDDNEKETVRGLLDALIVRRLFVFVQPQFEQDETSNEIFYWHFGNDVATKLRNRRLVIVGANAVAAYCARALRDSGFEQITILDDPLLRDRPCEDAKTQHIDGDIPFPSKADVVDCDGPETTRLDTVDCVIAVSSFGGQEYLRGWNRACVAQNIRFVPALLRDCIGEIGPLVLPRQSSCLECLRGRQNSHMENSRDYHDIDKESYRGRNVAASHPVMCNVVGSVVAMEVTKFLALGLLGQANRFIEVNLLRSEMIVRRVLKLPYCGVCGEPPTFSAIDISKRTVLSRDNT